MRYIYFGHHKCASQWTREVLQAIYTGGYRSVSSDEKRCDYGRDLGAYVRKTGSMLYGVANACYQNLGNMPDFKGFHVIRDPRDIVVSAFYSHRDRPGHPKQSKRLKKSSLEKGLIETMKGRAWQFENMRNWNYDDERILEVRFEDLIEDPVDVFQRVFAFWGFDYTERIEKIVPQYSFEKLTGRERGEEKQGESLRKGVAGEWRSHFTDKCVEEFEALYGDLVEVLGYDSD